MLEIGKLDRITAIIGERGTGKSTLAKYDARAFQRDTGGVVVGHSPNGQIGADRDIEFHDSLRAMERALRRAPEKMQIVASGAAPEEVIAYGSSLATALRRKAHERAGLKFKPHRPAPRGLYATPVMVVIDEGSELSKASTKADEEWLERILMSARHNHLALSWQIQAPTARNWVLQEQASHFRVFRYMHEWGLNAIRAAAIPKEQLSTIRDLPNFRYFHFDKIAPRSARFRALPVPGTLGDRLL